MKVKRHILLLCTFLVCGMFVGCTKENSNNETSKSEIVETTKSSFDKNITYSEDDGLVVFKNIKPLSNPNLKISELTAIEGFTVEESYIENKKDNSCFSVGNTYHNDDSIISDISYDIYFSDNIKDYNDKELQEALDNNMDDIRKLYDIIFPEDAEYMENLTKEMLSKMEYNVNGDETTSALAYLESNLSKEYDYQPECKFTILYGLNNGKYELTLMFSDLHWLLGYDQY